MRKNIYHLIIICAGTLAQHSTHAQCIATASINVAIENCTGIGEADPINLRISPNPSSDWITINGQCKSNNKELYIEIRNTLGQVIHQQPAAMSGVAFSEKLFIQNYQAGVYWIVLRNAANNDMRAYPFVKR